MDSTVAGPRTTAAVLEAFFSTHPMLRHPALAARARQVRLRLEDYLDTEAERWLTTGELEAVHEERRAVAAGLAGAEGVVARVTGPEALLCALPGFLEPRWWPSDRAAAKAQVLVVEELVGWLRMGGDPDPHAYSCGYLAAEVQVRRARDRLGRQPRSVLRLAPAAG